MTTHDARALAVVVILRIDGGKGRERELEKEQGKKKIQVSVCFFLRMCVLSFIVFMQIGMSRLKSGNRDLAFLLSEAV